LKRILNLIPPELRCLIFLALAYAFGFLLSSVAGANIVYGPENFNYAISSLINVNGANYTIGGAGAIGVQAGLGGKAATCSNGAMTGCFYNGATYSYTDLSVTAGDFGGVGSYQYIAARVSGGINANGFPNNGYVASFIGTTGVTLYKYIAGAPTTLSSTTWGPASPAFYQMRLVCNGTSISFYGNGVLRMGPITDAAYANGAIGFGGSFGFNQISAVIVDDGNIFTPTPTPLPTSTPTITPTPIFMAKFTPYVTPILAPVATWEMGDVATLSVINDNGTLRGAYWAGGYSSGAGSINIATSTDGYTWTRIGANPILGNGAGGESGNAERPLLLKSGSEYRIYYQDVSNNIALATSSDAATWAKYGTVISSGTVGPLNSAGAYYNGSTWLISAQYDHDYLFSSVDGKTGFSLVRGLTDLTQPGAVAGYSGRSFFVPRSGTIGGMIQDFYSSNTPGGINNLYHALAQDNNLSYFNIDQTSILTYAAVAAAGGGLATPDGLTNPSLVEFNGKVFMYYSVFSNTISQHKIGLAVYNGNMPQLFQALSASGKSYKIRIYDPTSPRLDK